ncbi:hypothetical protein [Ferruginibacter sp.]|nr:hypothetical protein [Ferruginibacter sp.]
MKLLYAFLFIAVVLTACNNEQANNKPANKIDGSFLNGSWTYRSLLNDTAWQNDFDSLEFAAAIMNLKKMGNDSVSGLLYWSQNPYQGLKITGKYYYNDTVTCYSLVGVGDSSLGTAGWQYNYQGYVVPHWSLGVNQADVLVGSTVRAKPHSGEPAGIVATTYMVRRSK